MDADDITMVPTHNPTNTVIDWSILDAFGALRKPGGQDPRARLMTVYLQSSPSLVEALRAALTAGDAPALITSAHSLKSSSSGIGATGFGRICAEIEQLGRANALQDASALLEQAEKEFAAVCAAFREALREYGD
jgi:HPt (histidine-containing phosphotransfer) domain-containing protein